MADDPLSLGKPRGLLHCHGVLRRQPDFLWWAVNHVAKTPGRGDPHVYRKWLQKAQVFWQRSYSSAQCRSPFAVAVAVAVAATVAAAVAGCTPGCAGVAGVGYLI
jgi:hypothetical protein